MATESEQLLEVLVRQNALHNETVSGYQKDRVVRQQEFDLKDRDYEAQIEALQKRLEEKKDLNYKLTAEYFTYKNAAQSDAKKLQDAIDLARVERDQLELAVERVVTV